MMELNGIQSVMQRITEIEKRFGIQHNSSSIPRNQTEFQNGGAQGKQPVSTNPALGNHVNTLSVSPMTATQGSNTSTSGDFNAMIKEASQKYNVDPKLVSAVAETESGFQQDAVSSAGAVGVMQLMPDTAAALGVNPYDEQQNIEGGAHYLREMLDDFGGDVRKAVAAYNAGAQAVHNYNGVPPYRETQDYVNKVLDLYQ